MAKLSNSLKTHFHEKLKSTLTLSAYAPISVVEKFRYSFSKDTTFIKLRLNYINTAQKTQVFLCPILLSDG
ncbi:MAG: hypothetical protein RR107_04930 [Clostridia bacterium]